MTIDKATLDKLLEGVDPSDPQSMFTDAGLFGQLKKALAERMLQAELTHHLEQQRNAPEPTRNHRNGSSKKSVLAAETKLELDIPRDRDGSFEPQLVAKHQRRLPGFDDKVISLYARGLPVREIQGHLTELYGLEVSPDLISTITGEVMDESSNGRTGRSNPCIRWCSSTRCGSRSATRVPSRTRPCIWRWACAPTAPRKSWASGSSRPKAPSSGCAS